MKIATNHFFGHVNLFGNVSSGSVMAVWAPVM